MKPTDPLPVKLLQASPSTLELLVDLRPWSFVEGDQGSLPLPPELVAKAQDRVFQNVILRMLSEGTPEPRDGMEIWQVYEVEVAGMKPGSLGTAVELKFTGEFAGRPHLQVPVNLDDFRELQPFWGKNIKLYVEAPLD